MKLPGKYRYILMALALIVGLTGFREAVKSLSSEFVYRKDLLAVYLQAKAIRAGIDPYQPLPELVQRLQEQAPTVIFPHPSPHPPALALLCLPLAWLEYEGAAKAWFFIQCLCLFASVETLLRWWRGRPSYAWSGIATLIAMGVGPAWEDMILGQVNIIQLFLFLFALRSLQWGREVAGGVTLAIAIAIKFIGWPLLLLLALRGRWRALAAAAVTLAAAGLLTVAALGWSVVAGYFMHVGPQVMALHRAHFHNWSLWGVAWRLFDGTGSPVNIGIIAAPLISAPQLALPASLALVGAVLLAGLWMACRAKRFETAYSVVICASLLISPLMWPHYLLMLAVPLTVAALDLRALGFPRKPVLASAILGLAGFFPRKAAENIATLFAISVNPEGEAFVPFAAATISFVPTLAALALMVWCYRLSRSLQRFSVGCDLVSVVKP